MGKLGHRSALGLYGTIIFPPRATLLELCGEIGRRGSQKMMILGKVLQCETIRGSRIGSLTEISREFA